MGYVTGKNVVGSVKLDGELDNVPAFWPMNMPFDPRRVHILVELPSGKRCVRWAREISLTAFFALDHATSESLSTLASDACDLWPTITIKAITQGDFGGRANAFERNRVFELRGAFLRNSEANRSNRVGSNL